MDKALAAIATVRLAIIECVRTARIPVEGRVRISAVKARMSGLRVRRSDFTDAMSSLVAEGLFKTEVKAEGLYLVLTQTGAKALYGRSKLTPAEDWVKAFQAVRDQTRIWKRCPANDGAAFGRRKDDVSGTAEALTSRSAGAKR